MAGNVPSGIVDEILAEGAGTPVGSLPVAGEDERLSGSVTSASEASNRSADAAIEERLAEQRKESERLHRAQMEQLAGRLSADAAKGRVLSLLDGFLKAQTGTEGAALKVRVGIHELKEKVFHGELGKEIDLGNGEKGVLDEAWFAGRAEAILAKVTEETIDAGGMGEDGLPGLTHTRLSDKVTDGHFSASRMLAGMVKEHGSDLKGLRELSGLKGSPEAEWCVAQESSPIFRDMLSQCPAGVQIPVPVAGFGGELRRAAVDELLSEQYSEAANTHEPTFDRRLLIDYFRPLNNLRFLLAGILTIDNNISVPVVTGAPTAQWRTDIQALTSTGLTLGKVTSKPQRVGVLDDISWMLQAAADQIGIQPLALMEMLLSVEQETERAYYLGSGANGQPAGAWNITGVDSFNPATNYAGWLEHEAHFNEENYDLGSVRSVMSWAAKRAFQVIFTNGSNNGYPLFRNTMIAGGGDGALGTNVFNGGQGFWLDRPAVASTQMPDTINSGHALTGGSGKAILASIWRYTLMLRYRMGVLTVDTMSRADTAQTRMSYNEFCDVLPRVPGAIQRTYIA